MPDVGDEVLIMQSLGESVAVPLGNVMVGDSVILYSLKDSTRIAVPILTLSIGDYVFSTPSFNFAGFNWSIDFNFQLIPLVINQTPPGTYWATSIVEVNHGTNGNASHDNCILSTSPNPACCTHLGDYGRIVVKFDDIVNFASRSCLITIYEITGDLRQFSFNPMKYLAPDYFTIYIPDTGENYRISAYFPNIIEIKLTSGNGLPYPMDPGNISGVKAVFT